MPRKKPKDPPAAQSDSTPAPDQPPERRGGRRPFASRKTYFLVAPLDITGEEVLAATEQMIRRMSPARYKEFVADLEAYYAQAKKDRKARAKKDAEPPKPQATNQPAAKTRSRKSS
jgi:hypothetical protein